MQEQKIRKVKVKIIHEDQYPFAVLRARSEATKSDEGEERSPRWTLFETEKVRYSNKNGLEALNTLYALVETNHDFSADANKKRAEREQSGRKKERLQIFVPHINTKSEQ